MQNNAIFKIPKSSRRHLRTSHKLKMNCTPKVVSATFEEQFIMTQPILLSDNYISFIA